MADNVDITPGTGKTIAADDIGGVLVQRVKTTFGTDGVSTDVSRLAPMPVTQGVDQTLIYFYNIPSQVHVNTVNTIMWDLFNGDATAIVRVLSVLQIPDVSIAVTGQNFLWTLTRSVTVGTGGVAANAWTPDSPQTALSSSITCRAKPTGGAITGAVLQTYNLSSEETNTSTIQIASQGGFELVPQILRNSGEGIVCRPGQGGLRCVQNTASAAGNTLWQIAFSVE
jgi:hypothetical protein